MPTTIYQGDCKDVLPTLPANSVQCVITSPPYWGLRDYGLGSKALGLEPTPELYVEHLVKIFREVKRVLRDDGVCWLNLGDSYASSPQSDNFADPKAPRRKPDGRCRTPSIKPKNLVGIPWRVAFALQADGWYLRSDIIWHKPNCMPESVTDRPTKAHEYVFLLTKSARYFYDAEAIKEDCSPNTHSRGPEYHKMNKTVPAGQGIKQNESWEAATWGPVTSRNRRTVWDIAEDHHPLFAYLLVNLTSDNPEYLDELLDRYSDDLMLKKDIWTIPTAPFPESHFATFAPALIEPMVKAGTSERGCCAACGAPWERVTEKTGLDRQRWAPGEDQYHTQAKGNHGTTSSFTTGDVAIRSTVGWQPTCKCGADDVVPCVCLDPFAGAGTVGLVADRLQRDAILIELSPTYAKMAKERIERDAPMFTSVEMNSDNEH